LLSQPTEFGLTLLMAPEPRPDLFKVLPQRRRFLLISFPDFFSPSRTHPVLLPIMALALASPPGPPLPLNRILVHRPRSLIGLKCTLMFTVCFLRSPVAPQLSGHLSTAYPSPAPSSPRIICSIIPTGSPPIFLMGSIPPLFSCPMFRSGPHVLPSLSGLAPASCVL